ASGGGIPNERDTVLVRIFDPIFVTRKRREGTDELKRTLVNVGECCRLPGVDQKTAQCLLALQTIDPLTGICEIRAKATRAFVHAGSSHGYSRIEAVVPHVVRRSETRQQNTREQ